MHKGVDAVLSDFGQRTLAIHLGGDSASALAQFEQEFNDDLAVIAHAVKSYGLNLANVDWLHSGAEQLLSFTNVCNVRNASRSALAAC